MNTNWFADSHPQNNGYWMQIISLTKVCNLTISGHTVQEVIQFLITLTKSLIIIIIIVVNIK